jgi:hypothetical protein
LGTLWQTIQAWLFPVWEDELGELDDRHREFVAVCEICEPRKHLAAYRWVGNPPSAGPPKDRLALCKAFIAKAVWDLFTPTTSALIDAVRHRPTLRRLCGWETLGRTPESPITRPAGSYFLPRRRRIASPPRTGSDSVAATAAKATRARAARAFLAGMSGLLMVGSS